MKTETSDLPKMPLRQRYPQLWRNKHTGALFLLTDRSTYITIHAGTGDDCVGQIHNEGGPVQWLSTMEHVLHPVQVTFIPEA